MITDVIVTTQDRLAYNLQFAALVWSMFAQLFFWTLYSPVNWRVHFVGRALFAQASALLFVFIVIVASRIFDFYAEDWVRTGSYFCLSLALTNTAYAMWRQQHVEHVDNDDEEHS